MLKPLLYAEPVSRVVKCRTSKSDELCRNLLFSIAWEIGPGSLKMVQTLQTTDIVIDSTQLPGNYHRDPADQLLVATARILNCPIVTSDKKILKYANVESIG